MHFTDERTEACRVKEYGWVTQWQRWDLRALDAQSGVLSTSPIPPFIYPTVRTEPTHLHEICWSQEIQTNRAGDSEVSGALALVKCPKEGGTKKLSDQIIF